MSKRRWLLAAAFVVGAAILAYVLALLIGAAGHAPSTPFLP